MRKVLVLMIMILSCTEALYAYALIEPDKDTHEVLGGLYALVSAVAVNDNTSPHINQLMQLFSDEPDNWRNTAQLMTVNNSIWAGVSVGKYSHSRPYLREHSKELGITDSPEGYSWFGGDVVWIKAADIVKGRLKPVKLKASESSGIIFFSTEGQVSWWQSHPNFTREAANEVLKFFGVSQAGLHVPEGVSENIYESVKPAAVQKPKDIHMWRRKSSFDVTLDVGKDLIFDPIPNRTRYRR